jgi:hypothetical protein
MSEATESRPIPTDPAERAKFWEAMRLWLRSLAPVNAPTDPIALATAIIESDTVHKATCGAIIRAAELAGTARPTPDQCATAARERKARIAPVAAAFGWLRDLYGGPWVDATNGSPGPEDQSPPLGDVSDVETLALLLVFSLNGHPLAASYALGGTANPANR